MIWFKQNLVYEAVKEVYDKFDVAYDLYKIDSIVYGIWTQDVLQQARQLDFELCQKYKTIDQLFVIARNMPNIPGKVGGGQVYAIPKEIEALRQDRFGILVDVLLKKGIIKEIKDFIDRVEE